MSELKRLTVSVPDEPKVIVHNVIKWHVTDTGHLQVCGESDALTVFAPGWKWVTEAPNDAVKSNG